MKPLMYVCIKTLKAVARIDFKAAATVTIMIKGNFCRLYLKGVLDFVSFLFCFCQLSWYLKNSKN